MDLLDEETAILYLIYRRLKKRRNQKRRLQTHKIVHLNEEATPVLENLTSFRQEAIPVLENLTSVRQEATPVLKSLTSFRQEAAPVLKSITSFRQEAANVSKYQAILSPDACGSKRETICSEDVANVPKNQTIFSQEAADISKHQSNTSGKVIFVPKCQISSIQKVTNWPRKQSNKIVAKKSKRTCNSLVTYLRYTSSEFSKFYLELRSDDDKFFEYARISIASFDELLGYIKDNIKKQDTQLRDSIKSEERLLITLRYLASGCFLAELKSTFGVGLSTVSKMVREVTPCIWSALAEKEIPPLNPELFLEISQGFQESRNFPHCIGVVDGKHIRIKQTDNYNKLSSLVLLAMCDSTYKFTYIEIAKLEDPFDSHIFKSSVLRDKLLKGSLDIPPASQLEGDELFPYVILGDKGFSMSENLLRPYGKEQLEERKMFNDRLSSARQCIESTFGIMVNTWQVLSQPLSMHLDAVENIVKAVCVLHNFVLRRDGNRYSHLRELRQKTALFDIDDDLRSKPNRKTLFIRDRFATFFVNNPIEKHNE